MLQEIEPFDNHFGFLTSVLALHVDLNVFFAGMGAYASSCYS